MGKFRLLFGLALQATLAFSLRNETATCNRSRPQPMYGVTWVPEPPGRGSLSILVSCVATFIFCVWTTVHPNIIPVAQSRFRLYYRTWQTIMAVLVPEGVLLCAFGQRVEAHMLKKGWREHFKNSESKEAANYLGVDGAFFVLMGGFVVRDTSTCCGTPQSELGELPTLTSAGFNALVKNNRINQKSFSKREIRDKGNASNAAKLLSGLQALWLLAQCAARWLSDYNVTLLELHVFIQVIITFFIYICWWYKPLDVIEPITISLDLAEYHDHDPEPKDKPGETNRDLEAAKSRTEGKRRPKYKGDDLKNPKSRLLNHGIGDYRAAVAAKAFYDVVSHIKITSAFQDPSRLGEAERAKAETLSSKRGVFAEGLLVVVMGALHMAAWNSHFPTSTERLLWRISCLGLFICAIVVVLAMFIANYEQHLILAILRVQGENRGFNWLKWALKETWVVAKKLGGTPRGGLLYFSGIWVCIGLIVSYISSVVYITIESVISLRDPPDNVFCTIRFTDYWPHI